MTTETACYVTYVIVCCLLMWRNSIVCRVRVDRIERIHAANQSLIDTGEFVNLHPYEAIGFAWPLQMLDLSSWTYEQFYPNGLPERVSQ